MCGLAGLNMQSIATNNREAASFVPATSEHAATSAKKNLSRRALLGTAGGLLNQGASLFTALVLTPMTASLLGQAMFGVWTMISQIANYLALGDFRVASVLKYQLASLQHSEDLEHKRRLVGASVLLLLVILPLMFMALAVVAWQAPSIFQGPSEHHSGIVWAIVTTGIAMVLTQVISIPGGVMRGENLDYIAMWLRSSLMVVTGVAGVGLLMAGWGLMGLAFAVFARQIIFLLVWQRLARRHVAWYGVACPKKSEVVSFTQGSFWVFCSGLFFLALSTSDIILAGILLGPKAASIYYISGSLLRFILVPAGSFNAASGPGIAGLCGTADWRRLQRVMREYCLITHFYLALIGIVVLAVNSSFVALWMGQSYNGGNALLIALLAGRVLLSQLEADGNVLDGMMCFRQRALVLIAGAVLAVAISILAGREWGLTGVALGPVVGRLFTLVQFRRLIARTACGLRPWDIVRPRLVIATAALWALVCVSSRTFRAPNWLGALALGAIVTLIAFGLIYYTGLDAADRSVIQARFENLRNRFLRHFPKPRAVADESHIL